MAPSEEGHNVAEEAAAYRRGAVLGLTMAEAAILIIFVLLLLIGYQWWKQRVEKASNAGKTLVGAERLQSLEHAETLLDGLKAELEAEPGASSEAIVRLVQRLKAAAGATDSETALAAVEKMQEIEKALAERGGSEELAKAVERQSFQIANQEGQLVRCEARLEGAGLERGERPCWANSDGSVDYVYDVVLSMNGIRMREYEHPNRSAQRALLSMPRVDPKVPLQENQFLKLTRPLYDESVKMKCRFFVVVFDGTDVTAKIRYKRLLKTVEGHFYKRLVDAPPPF